MGIPDPNPKAYGGHKSSPKTFTETETGYYNDTFWYRNSSQFSRDWDGFNREGTKNPLRYLPGTSTAWRNPGHYRREAHRWVTEKNSLVRSPVGDAWRPDGGWGKHYRTYERVVFGVWDPTHPWFAGHTSPADMSTNTFNQLSTEVMVKLGDAKSAVGANLAEAVSTYRSFAGILTPLVRSAIAIKRGRWGEVPRIIWGPRGRDPVKDASDAYLLWHFGIRPMMQDAYGLYELLQEQLQPALLLHARRTIRDSWSGDTDVDMGSNLLYNAKSVYKRKDAMHVTARVSNAYARNLSRAGLINPAQIAWEVVPYSFIVDWVMPVGNIIEAMDARTGLTFVGGWYHTVIQGDTRSVLIGNGVNEVIDGGAGRIEKFAFRRSTLGDFPLPAPYVKSPFTGSHVVTLAALFGQLTR